MAAGDVTADELATLAAEAAKIVNPALNAVIELHDTPSRVDTAGGFLGVPTRRKDLAPESGRLLEEGQPGGHIAARRCT